MPLVVQSVSDSCAQSALAEGKKGGQYFTPKSIVSLIAEMIEPYQGRVYDPAMGARSIFESSLRDIGLRFSILSFSTILN